MQKYRNNNNSNSSNNNNNNNNNNSCHERTQHEPLAGKARKMAVENKIISRHRMRSFHLRASSSVREGCLPPLPAPTNRP